MSHSIIIHSWIFKPNNSNTYNPPVFFPFKLSRHQQNHFENSKRRTYHLAFQAESLKSTPNQFPPRQMNKPWPLTHFPLKPVDGPHRNHVNFRLAVSVRPPRWRRRLHRAFQQLWHTANSCNHRANNGTPAIDDRYGNWIGSLRVQWGS